MLSQRYRKFSVAGWHGMLPDGTKQLPDPLLSIEP